MQRAAFMTNAADSKSFRYPKVVLLGCFFLAALICYGHIKGSTAVLTVCLTAFLLFTLWACDNAVLFPVLLFFLPWSPLFKLYKGGISFFTIALLISCAYFLAKNHFTLDMYQMILSAILMISTLTAKALQGNSIANNYLFFLVMLLLFPCVAKGCSRQASFWELTLFFACGIISAALSAQQVAEVPNISRYITVESYLSITRLSGFYGDPNFYSAHITACLAGVLLLATYETNRLRRLVLTGMAIVLIYCGLLSASKSFVIVAACLFLVWIPILLKNRNRGSGRLHLLVGILCAAGIIMSSSAFKELFRIVDTRFAYASNVSELTTGRTELWANYLHEFTHNPLLTVFGEGYTSVNLNGKASHNSIIQAIYQFGIVGLPLIALWAASMLRKIFSKQKAGLISRRHVLLMGIGIVLPWMGLDILFFDEFFLLPVYGALGVLSLSDAPSSA